MHCQVTGRDQRDQSEVLHDAIATHWNIVLDEDGKEIRRYPVCSEHAKFASTAKYSNGAVTTRIESI